MYLKTLNLGDIHPYERNPRINDKAVEPVMKSIQKDGYRARIIVDNNGIIIAGHTRYEAMKRLGWTEAEVWIADDMTPEQIADYRIRDNLTADFAEWDFSELEAEIQELDLDFDMSEFEGFEDIQGGVSTDTSTIEDDEYDGDAPTEPKAKLGQIYQLGQHRLMCGSSTDEDNVAALMDGERAAMLFTSPPYSDMREYEGGKDLSVDNLAQFIKLYRPYTDYQCVNLGIQRKNNEIVPYWDEYTKIAHESGYKMLAWNVWDKLTCGSIGQQKAFFPLRHEFVFVYGTEFYEINETVEKKEDSIRGAQMKSIRQKDGTMKEHYIHDAYNQYKQMESVLSLLSEHGEIRSLHPATFPVGLPGEYIKAMTQKNDIVIEPFGGSGTTLIACEQTGRQCRIMELEPKYVDVIINRWEKFTGEKAVLLNG